MSHRDLGPTTNIHNHVFHQMNGDTRPRYHEEHGKKDPGKAQAENPFSYVGHSFPHSGPKRHR